MASLAGVVCAGAACAAAALADSPVISATIYNGHGSTQQSVSLSELQQNAGECPEYAGAGGTMVEYGRGMQEETQGLPHAGPTQGTWALATVLHCLANPIDPAAVTAVVVLTRDGSAEQPLAAADLSPGQFKNASEVPVIEDFGDQIGYDRPWRGGSDEDYLDQVQEPSGSPVNVEVYEGPTLPVTATADPTTLDAGGSVAFSSNVQGPDTGLSYAWTFDGGAPASSDPSPHETFASAGLYNANLIVTDRSTGAIGSTQPIAITVTSPSGQQTTTTGGNQPGGGQGQPTTPTGPQRSSGTTPGGTGQHHHRTQPSTGGTQPTAGPRSSSRSSQRSTRSSTGRGDSHHSGGASPSTPVTSPIASSPVSTPASTPGPPTSAPQSHTTPHRSPHTAAARHDHAPTTNPTAPTTNPPAQSPPISGRLIEGIRPLPLSASPLARTLAAQEAAAAALRPAVRRSPLPVLAGAAAALLLLVLGAARELQWRPHLRALRTGG